jgi:flagellar biosynthesis/type III secretory pathway protein FliH
MLSRARRVHQAVEPYDWNDTVVSSLADGPTSVPAPARIVAMPIREPYPSAAEPVDDAQDDPSPGRLSAIERDAFAKGYTQGERSGNEAGATRADAMLRRLTATLEELATLRNDVLHRAERQVVQLALALAHRMLQRELDVDRGLLLAMARVALDRMGENARATIRLHPDDYASVMTAREQSLATDQVQVVADTGVGRGGCLVQSDFGLMDAGLDSQIREMARALLDQDTREPEPAHVLVHPLQAVADRS